MNNLTSIQDAIKSNRFVDRVRQEMVFDESEWQALNRALIALAEHLRAETTVEKEVALFLYTAPLMVRNAFLSYGPAIQEHPAIAFQLEDAWIELDQLVTDCLVTVSEV